jgi:GNAT superfamily N-acetyltransferase
MLVRKVSVLIFHLFLLTRIRVCFSLKRRIAVRNVKDPEAQEAVGYGIASVFTLPAYRKRGYASHMMKLLHRVLAPSSSLPAFPTEWGTPPGIPPSFGNAVVSVLYSDVGENFYRLCGPAAGVDGWVPSVEHTSTIWKLEGIAKDEHLANEQVKYLNIDEIEPILELDDKAILDDLNCTSASSTRFVFFSANGLNNFQVQRYLLTIPSETTPIPSWGAYIPGSRPPHFALWVVEPAPLPSRLIITRLRCDAATFPGLIRAAQKVLVGHSIAQLEVWNLPSELKEVAKGLGGVTEVRLEHLPSVAWYGERKDAVEWVHNEKYYKFRYTTVFLWITDLLYLTRRYVWC